MARRPEGGNVVQLAAVQGAKGRRGRGGGTQADKLLTALDGCALWHTPDREAFITLTAPNPGGQGDHAENWPLRHKEARAWLSGRFYDRHGTTPGAQAMEDALRVLEGRALREGECHAPALRVGEHGGRIYLDLADPLWRAVEIGPSGWCVVPMAPVKFVRPKAMRPLPAPEAGGLIEALRGYVNLGSDDDWRLVVGYLVGALRPRGPYPILCINGEQGSAKSTTTRMLRALIDPNASPLRSPPRDERDLVVSADNSWALAFDNLSSIEAWNADALCRLSTGGGFATRALHTDRDELVIEAQRPVILNGIPDLGNRADLADRSLAIVLPAIPEGARQSEAGLWERFDAARPAILGALCDAVACALRRLPSIELPSSPRMADFAAWVTAAEPALGWADGAFLATYAGNRAGQVEVAIDADPVAVGVRQLADEQASWEGTATALLEALEARVPERQRGRNWPGAAHALSARVRRAAAPLRQVGVVVQTFSERTRRTIRISRQAT